MHPVKSPNPPSLAILSHLRWGAAFIVAVSHIRANMMVDYKDLAHPGPGAKALFMVTGYGHAGVVVFFALSGFLVGGKALSLYRDPQVGLGWTRFLVDRFSRIFVVLWPALIVSLIIWAAVLLIAPQAGFVVQHHWGPALSAPLSADTPWRWLQAAVLLNEFVSPTITTDGPLWSLAYEWFYYVAALAVVLLARRIRTSAALCIVVYSVVLLGLSLAFHPSIATAGLIWVEGLTARIIFDRHLLSGKAWRVVGLLVLGSALAIDRAHPIPDLVMGLAISFVIANADWREWRWGARLGDRLAGFSYSLYVTHFPVTLLTLALLYRTTGLNHRLPFDAYGLSACGLTLLLTLGLARGFAWVTEDRTHAFRTVLLRWLTPRRAPTSASQAAGL